MMRNLIFLFFFSILICPGVNAYPGNELDACEDLQQPFDSLAQMTINASVVNPPQVQLCHRIATAEKHYKLNRYDKAVDEISKYMKEVKQSTPQHMEEVHAKSLIAEAERVISEISGDVVITGTASGGVFDYLTKQSIIGASVYLSFVASEQTYSTQTDENGFFQFENLPLAGAFVVSVTDETGSVGSAQGSLLEGESVVSLLVVIDRPGNGGLQGYVSSAPSAGEALNALVTAIFPESKREFTTKVGSDGYYRLDDLPTDGTVIVVAFDNDSGVSASYSTVITPYHPFATVNLVLVAPAVVNPELVNGNFADGLAGWTYSGPIQVVERDLYFGTQN